MNVYDVMIVMLMLACGLALGSGMYFRNLWLASEREYDQCYEYWRGAWVERDVVVSNVNFHLSTPDCDHRPKSWICFCSPVLNFLGLVR